MEDTLVCILQLVGELVAVIKKFLDKTSNKGLETVILDSILGELYEEDDRDLYAMID